MNSHNHSHDHPGGSAELYFEHGFGQAISSLTVRLTAGGNSFTGTTDKNGLLPPLRFQTTQQPANSDHDEWMISGTSPMRVTIEIRKSNGAWKHIAAFNLQDGQRKLVTVSANSTASPMPLAMSGVA
ncbi:hypothetical protein V4C85_11910 [Ralstonia solanacearum]|uniref:hypothetical protein n=1 Tax=Ralstonia solanacearum TaxID=305 RepID=UPI0012DA5AA4|nr:hypothetical protein [Ralstonia solanacearum]